MAHAAIVLEMVQRPRPMARTVEVPEVVLNRLIRVEIYSRRWRNEPDTRQRAYALKCLYAELDAVEAAEWDYDHV